MRPSTVGGENFCPWPHPEHPSFKPRPSRLALARINLTAGGRRVYLVSFPFVLPAVAFPTGFLMHPRTDSYFCNIPTFSLLISFSLGLGSWVFFLWDGESVRLAPSADRLFVHITFRVAPHKATPSLLGILLPSRLLLSSALASRVSESDFVPVLVSRVSLDPSVFLTSSRRRLSTLPDTH